MIARKCTYVRTKQRIIPDCYLSAIKKRTSKINIDIIPDRNVFAEFTGKIRLQPNAFSYFLEELAHDFLTPISLFVFRTVKFLE